MGIDSSLRKIPISEIIEGARKQLVAALKFGTCLVICMTVAVCDFATKFNDDPTNNQGSVPSLSYFPKEVFVKAGKALTEQALLSGRHFCCIQSSDHHQVQPGRLRGVSLRKFMGPAQELSFIIKMRFFFFKE